MSKLPFKRSLNALKPPTEPLAPKRLLGFREWCQQVYEPSKELRLQSAMMETQRINKESVASNRPELIG